MRRVTILAALVLSLLLTACCGSTSRQAAAPTKAAQVEATTDHQQTPPAEGATAQSAPTLAATAEPPTAEPPTEEPPTPTPAPAGLTRSDPLPLGSEFRGEEWSITITGVTRGDEAAQLAAEANRFNDPPAPGYEYLIADITLTNISTEDDAKSASFAVDLRVTGDKNTLYSSAMVVPPKPFEGEVFPGGTAEGQKVFEVPSDEKNLQFVVSESLSFDSEARRFVAIDDGASIAPDPSLRAVKPTELGTRRAEPAQIGDTLVAGSWEFAVLEVVRGDQAATMVAKANQFNDPAPEGEEYVVARLRARYLGTPDPDGTENINSTFLKITGERNIVYDRPMAVAPDPRLDATLFAGGETEGWAVVSAGQGEAGLMLIFEPLWSFSGEDVRYIAIE